MIRGVLLLCFFVAGQAQLDGTLGTAVSLTASQANTINYAAGGESIVVAQANAVASSTVTLSSPSSGANAPAPPSGYTVEPANRYFIEYSGAGTGNFKLTSFVTRQIAAASVATTARVLLQWHADINSWVQLAALPDNNAAAITTANVVMYRQGTTATATAVLAVAEVANSATAVYYTSCQDIASNGACTVDSRITITFTAAVTNVAVSYGTGALQGNNRLLGKYLNCWVAVALPTSYTGTYTIAAVVATNTFTDAPTVAVPGQGNWADGGFARMHVTYSGSAGTTHFYREKATTVATGAQLTVSTAGLSGSNRYALIADFAFPTNSIAGSIGASVAIGASQAFVLNSYLVAEWTAAATADFSASLEAEFTAASTVAMTTPTTGVTGVAGFTGGAAGTIFKFTYSSDTAVNTPPKQPVVRLAPGNGNTVVTATTLSNFAVAYCADPCTTPELVPAIRTQANAILFLAAKPGTYHLGTLNAATDFTTVIAANVATWTLLPRSRANLVSQTVTNTNSGFSLPEFICNDANNNEVTVTAQTQAAADFNDNAAPSGFIKVAGAYQQLSTTCTNYETKIRGTYADNLTGVTVNTIRWARATSTTSALVGVGSDVDVNTRVVTTTNVVSAFSSWTFVGEASAGTTPSSTPSTTTPGAPTAPTAPGSTVPAAPTSGAIRLFPVATLLLAAIFAVMF